MKSAIALLEKCTCTFSLYEKVQSHFCKSALALFHVVEKCNCTSVKVQLPSWARPSGAPRTHAPRRRGHDPWAFWGDCPALQGRIQALRSTSTGLRPCLGTRGLLGTTGPDCKCQCPTPATAPTATPLAPTRVGLCFSHRAATTKEPC